MIWLKRFVLRRSMGKDSDSCRAAIEKLCVAGPAGVDLLIEALKDSETKDPDKVVEALGQTNDPRSLVPLIDAMDDKRLNRWRMDRVLAAFGEPAIPLLLQKLERSSDKIVREVAIRSLGLLKSPSALNGLVQALKDPNDSVVSAAADALKTLGDSRSIRPLLQVRSGRHTVKDDKCSGPIERALLELGWRPEDATSRVEWLIKMGHYEEAAEAGEAAWKPLCVLLDETVDSQKANDRRLAFSKAFAKMGSIHPNLLLEGLKAKNDIVRAASAIATGMLKEKRALPQLGEMLLQSDLGYNVMPARDAVKAILQIASPESTELLAKACKSDQRVVRCLIAAELAENSTRFVPFFLQFSSDPDPNVRWIAIRALGQQGDSASHSAILKAASDNDLALMLAAVDLLLQKKDPRATELKRSAATAVVYNNTLRYVLSLCNEIDAVFKAGGLQSYREAQFLQPFYEARLNRIGDSINSSGGREEKLRICKAVAAQSKQGRYLEGVWFG